MLEIPKIVFLEYKSKKALSVVLGFIGRIAPPPKVSVDRIPVDLTQSGQRFLRLGRGLSAGCQNQTQTSGGKPGGLVIRGLSHVLKLYNRSSSGNC